MIFSEWRSVWVQTVFSRKDENKPTTPLTATTDLTHTHTVKTRPAACFHGNAEGQHPWHPPPSARVCYITSIIYDPQRCWVCSNRSRSILLIRNWAIKSNKTVHLLISFNYRFNLWRNFLLHLFMFYCKHSLCYNWVVRNFMVELFV